MFISHERDKNCPPIWDFLHQSTGLEAGEARPQEVAHDGLAAGNPAQYGPIQGVEAAFTSLVSQVAVTAVFGNGDAARV